MKAPPAGESPLRIRGTCSVNGCDGPHKAHGMCTKHYMRWRKHGDPQVVLTATGGRRSAGFERFLADLDQAVKSYEGGVLGTVLAQRYGVTHNTVMKYLRQRGVQIRPRGHDLYGHTKRLLTPEQRRELARLYRNGAPIRQLQERFSVSRSTIKNYLRQEDEPPRLRRRTPRLVDDNGYVKILVAEDDPCASMRNKVGYVLEHRLKMARKLGRPLTADETVHHKNGIRDDNRLRNLELRQGKHGNGQSWRCADCGSRNLVAV